MLTIPPKTSHRLQPLDVSVLGPFKRSYNKAMDNRMRTYPGKTLTIYEVPALVKEAQLCALVPRNILSGFKNTGTWPYNPDIFAEDDFAAVITTDRPAPDIQIPLINNLPVDSARSSACSSQSMLIGNGPITHTMQAGSSVDDATLTRAEKTTSPEHFAAPSSIVYVSPSDVYSIPKAQPRKSKSSARKGKTQILTSTPVREKYALLKKQKEVKNLAKVKKSPNRFFVKRKRSRYYQRALLKKRISKLSMMITLLVRLMKKLVRRLCCGECNRKSKSSAIHC